MEEDEELGIERHAFGLSLPTMPRQTLVFELTMVQVLAEDDAGAQSPIVDEEPDEAAEGEGVDRRGERRCQVRMQSALGDTRQDDPILQVRCKAKELQKKLNILHTSIPSTGQLRKILKTTELGRRQSPPNETSSPSGESIQTPQW